MTGVDRAALTSDEALTALWKHLPDDLGPDHADAPSLAVLADLKRAVEMQIAAQGSERNEWPGNGANGTAPGSGGDDTSKGHRLRIWLEAGLVMSELLCPESGCEPVDGEGPVAPCWLRTWAENEDLAANYVQESVPLGVFSIEASFVDDQPVVRIVAPAASSGSATTDPLPPRVRSLLLDVAHTRRSDAWGHVVTEAQAVLAELYPEERRG